MQATEFWKRFLALMLCFVMVLSTIPTAALATAINEEESWSEEYSEEIPEQEEDPLPPEEPEAALPDEGEVLPSEEPEAPAPSEEPAQPEQPVEPEDPVVPEEPETVLPDEDAESEDDEDEEEDLAPLDLPATVSIKASFTAQWEGEFATKPLLDMTVSSDTAENYGFKDQTDSETAVSTVDVLVAAHVAKYGDAFTKDTAENYLVIGSNFITTIFGHDTNGNLCVLVNGKQPGNNGIEQAVMEDGDILELFEYQSINGDWTENTNYLDKYLWLETKEGQKLDGITLDGGVAVELVVKGYAPFYANYNNGLGDTTTVSGAGIYMVNMEDGSLTSLNATSGEGGAVTVTIPKDKIGETIYLTAKGKEMAMSLNKVTVTAPPATTGTTLSGLEVAVGGSTQESAVTQTLSPAFAGDTKSYTTPILDYQASNANRYVWVKVNAGEGATVTAQCTSSETVTLTSGEWARVAVKTMSWGTAYYSGCLETGKYNTLTITVTADGQTETYTVTIPMQPDTSKSKLSWKTDLPEQAYCNPSAQGKVLSVEAQYENRPLDDKNEITYQWYTASTADGEGTALEGQTGASYTASTTDVGVKYYYVVATCGEKTLKSQVIALHVTEDAAPTSITVVCDYEHTVPDTWVKALGGKDYVAKVGDKLTLRALDQDGKETPVQWPTNLTTGTLSATTGSTVEYTIVNTSYGYITVSSLFDSTVKSEEKAVVVKDYSFSAYNKAPSTTLATDGQSNPSISTNGGLNGYNLWTYEMDPENVGQLTTDLSKKGNSLSFQALRPGTITASFDLDLDGDGKGDGLTDTATLTIKGIAVEDADGNLGKTYLETSAKNANPTVQLKALSSTENATFTWSSADETVATVDANGLVTAKGVGSVIISAKDSTYTGGIKVVVTSADVPYFEALDFTTVRTNQSGLSQNSWKSANFKPATLSYTGLTMTKAAADTLTFSANTLYDTKKWVATAAYTDADGAAQSVAIASGAATELKNLPLETSTITVTLAAKDNAERKTVYTFEVTRPRDTTKTIASGGIVFTPEGRDLWKDKYDNREEGVMYEAKSDGSFGTYKGVDYRRTYYRVYAMNALEAFTLNIKGGTNFTHIRCSVDDGENWIYLGQTGAEGQKSKAITFPERTEDDTNPVVKVTIQILDDATYAANVKAEKDGFADATPSSYYVWVEQIGVTSAECNIETATTSYGDWYPEFKPELTTYRLVTGVGTELPEMTFTISDGAKVYLGETLQTPGEDGKYTLQLTEDNQSLVVKASDGMTEKTYTFGASAKLSDLYPDKVVDYLSVNSQYTNGRGGYGIMPQQTLTGGLLSLGNFGGYVTFYYEDGLTDDPSHPYGVDFYVDGNAFVDTSTGTGLGSMEPGQVWVSEDGNTWYALAGSEHYEDSTLWNYSVTYSKTEAGGTTWVDNQGNTSASTHGRGFLWPDASIYTMNDLATKDSFTLTGVLIPCVDGTVAGTDNFNSFSKGVRFGYVDAMVNGTSNPYAYNGDYKNASSGFDLAWAVDASGNPVDVSGKSFHYVKVVTASNLMAGAANEKSTEVASVTRVASTGTAVGKTSAPAGVTFTSSDNSYVLDFETGKTTYEVELPGMDTVSIQLNGTSESDNIYINNQRVTSGTAATGFAISDTTQRLIRIIVQNGEKEPVLYLLKVKNIPKPRLELMVNNSYMADKQNPQKAELGEDGIFRIANRGSLSSNYIWLSVDEGTTVDFTLLRGKTISFSKYMSPRSSNNVFEDTTYQYYINNSVSLPLVAKFDVTGANDAKATYYLIVDKGEIGAYTIGGSFTSESNLLTSDGIAFTEAGQKLTLAVNPTTIGTGEEATAPSWTYTTSNNHVATVDSKTGEVTSVGGGEATITATYQLVTVTTKVTSTAPEHKIHTYGSNNKCTICGDKKPNDIKTTFTLVDKEGAYAKSGETELYKAALTVSDLDCDGTITYVDLFNAAHTAFCTAGAEGFTTVDTEFGPFITKFWGEETSNVSYFANNKSVNAMTDKVSANTNLVAFFYRDTEKFTDLYTWFDKDSSKYVTGMAKTYTVHGANDQAPNGATVTVLDSTGAEVESLATTVDENGTFTITYPTPGSYTIWVKGTASYNFWDEDVTGAPVVPCFQKVEVSEPKTAVLNITIVDDENNFVRTTDGEEVYRYAFTAMDDPENPDGKVTVYEALQQIHEQKCPAGAAGFVATSYITTVWGVNTGGWLSYYFDDVWMQGYGATLTGTYDREFVDKLLGTEINPNGKDDYCLYMYQSRGDIYTYFYPREQTAIAGVAKEFTVNGDQARKATVPAGASITVTDSKGNVLPDLSTTVDENGKFSVTFPAAGSYTIDLGNAAKKAYTHSRCFVTVSGVEATQQTLIAGQSTTLTLRDENGNQRKDIRWTLAEGDDAYVTMTTKNGIATVKAQAVSEKHTVVVNATTAEGEMLSAAVITIIPKAQGITLSGEKTVTVDIGDKDYVAPSFTATVLPADATQSVTWTSSNKKVATVTDGKLTLTGTLGTAKITATTTDGSKLSASVTVNVVKLAQSIQLSGAETIIGGKTATFAAAEEDGTAIKATNITWSLSDTTYASVNTSGKVTTKAVPETTEVTLTATIKGSERCATKTITIVPASTYVDVLEGETVVTGKTLKRNVNAGETALNLTAAAYPTDADQNVKWTSSNAKIATVADGVVTYAGKPGTVTITATTTDGSNKKATVKITFSKLSTKVEITNPAPESETILRSGSKLTLSASTDLAKVGVNWSLANAADKSYVTLSGSKLTAKTVYETHEVTLIATAKDGGAAATTTVTIQPKDNNVLILKHGNANVTKTTQSVNRGVDYTLTAANVGGDAQNVTWKTSNKKIVSLTATEGENVTLNLLKAGTATITATAADGSKTTVTIKVTTLVESLSITGSDTVASGKSVTLKAVTTPSTAANKAVTWTLKEGSAYATISSSGKLTANKNLMSAKTITVQATARDGSGVTAEKTVTIQPVATSVVMQQKAQTVDMQKEATFQLSTKVYPSAANDAVNWTSSSTKIATVDKNGLVTFHKGGTVTITATAADGSGKKASVKLTVVKSVESLELDNNFLAGGKSLNLAKLVKVGPSDATNKKVIWTMTGDTAYATLSASGVLKAKTVTQMKTVTVTATAADGYGAKATATIEIYPATTKVVIQADGETVTGTVKLPEGDSLQLNAISLPLDAYQDWTWTSSKNAWAEVDETGCVTGLTAGKTVTITATAKDGTNKKATLKIKIVND